MSSTTARRLLVVAVLIVATATAAQSSQSQVSGTPAASIVRELVSLPFGGSMTDWRRMHQRAEWVNYPLAPELSLAEQEWSLTGDWCAIARDSNDAYSRQAIFYPYRPELPLGCRLEELRYEFRETAGRPDPYDDLSATLERQFGKPFWVEGASPEDERLRSEMVADYRRHRGLPMELWRQSRYWTNGTSEVFLFRYQRSVQVIARTSLLSAVGSRSMVRGAGAARIRAIEFYERVLRVAPDSYEAMFALRSLIRLKTGVYTGGTYFYCRYA